MLCSLNMWHFVFRSFSSLIFHKIVILYLTLYHNRYLPLATHDFVPSIIVTGDPYLQDKQRLLLPDENNMHVSVFSISTDDQRKVSANSLREVGYCFP